jgi:hypothetical protein
MAYRGPIPVDHELIFRDGAYAAGPFEAVRDFDRSQGDRFVQQRDKGSDLPLWVVEIVDADPSARPRTVKVKVASPTQPVLPSGAASSPFVPVAFEGLNVTHYVTQDGRLGRSYKATGVHVAGRPAARPGRETADAA